MTFSIVLKLLSIIVRVISRNQILKKHSDTRDQRRQYILGFRKCYLRMLEKRLKIGWQIHHQKTITKFFFDLIWIHFSELFLNILNIKIDCMKLNAH